MNPGLDVKWQDYEHLDELCQVMKGRMVKADTVWTGERFVLLDEEFWSLLEQQTEEPRKPTTPTLCKDVFFFEEICEIPKDTWEKLRTLCRRSS